MKNIIVIIFSLLSLVMVACESDEASIVPDGGQQGQGADVGPFTLMLSSDTTLQQNSFSVPINQDEGKVEFNFTARSETTWMRLRFAHTAVTECDETQVDITKVWSTGGNDELLEDQMFSAGPGQTGQVVILFQNIAQCSSLSFNMVVDHVTDPYQHPKDWSFVVDQDLKGTWESNEHQVKLDVEDSYFYVESSKVSFCGRSFSLPLTDSSQSPSYLGASSDDDVLCSYTHDEEGDTLSLSCFDIPGWNCDAIEDITLTRTN